MRFFCKENKLLTQVLDFNILKDEFRHVESMSKKTDNPHRQYFLNK